MTDETPDTEPHARPAGEPDPAPVTETFRADLPRRKTRKPRPRPSALRIALICLAALGVLLVTVAGVSALTGYLYVKRHYLNDMPTMPPREELFALNRAPAIKFFDRNGKLIA